MKEGLTRDAGSALKWQTIQMVGVKGIYLVRIPILAWLLAPDDFGLLAIALVAVDILMRLTDVGMTPALVQRQEVEESHYHSAWSVGMTRSLIVCVGVFAAAPMVATIFQEPRAIPIIRALALRPILDASASMKVADLTRNLRFRGLAMLHLTAALLNAVVSIALAPFLGVWALVAGALAGPAAYGVFSYVVAPFRPRYRLDVKATRSLIRFGRWVFVIGLIGLASRFVLQAVISRRLGTVELGLYYLAARIAYLPLEVSSELIGSVAFPVYSRLQSDLARAQQAFRIHLRWMLGLLLPVSALLLVLAPSLVEHLLGPGWAGTAPAIQVLAAANMIALFGEAFEPIFMGSGRPWAVALLVGIQTAVLTIFVWELAGRYGLPGAVAAWLPALAAAQITGLVLLGRMMPGAYKGLARPFLAIVFIGFLGALLAFIVDQAVPGLLGLLMASGFGMLLVGLLLLRADGQLGLGIGEGLAWIRPGLVPLLARLGLVNSPSAEGARTP